MGKEREIQTIYRPYNAGRVRRGGSRGNVKAKRSGDALKHINAEHPPDKKYRNSGAGYVDDPVACGLRFAKIEHDGIVARRKARSGEAQALMHRHIFIGSAAREELVRYRKGFETEFCSNLLGPLQSLSSRPQDAYDPESDKPQRARLRSLYEASGVVQSTVRVKIKRDVSARAPAQLNRLPGVDVYS